MLKNKLLLILSFGILFFSCESDNSNKNLQNSDTKKAILKNIATNGAQAQLEKSLTDFESVMNEVHAFKANKTDSQLNKLKETFASALISWKACEIYEMGKVKKSFLYGYINSWPAAPERIEQAITNATNIDQDYIKKLGFPMRGISTMEYLLYDKATTETLQEFKNQAKRIDYLEAICEEVILKIKAIQQSWKEYSEEFSANEIHDKLESGENISINTMIVIIENIKNFKLGLALGDKNGGKEDAGKLEAFRSHMSLAIIQANIKSLEMMFNGDYKNATPPVGFDDYLIQLNRQDLVEKVNHAFQEVNNEIQSFNGESLAQVIKTNPEKAKQLQGKVRNLLVLFKVDVASTLGTIITIGDNDGD